MKQKILLEIGVEELPARFIDNASEQLRRQIKSWLNEQRILFETIDVFSTPRRLAVVVHGVAEQQTTKKEEVRGPSQKIAQHEDGSWSKAAIGFTKGQGTNVDAITIKDVNGTPYIFVTKVTEGKKTADVLPNMKSIIPAIQFQETMYWNKDTIPYARPIRWIVALYGDQVIPFEVAHVQSGRTTYGHRFLGSSVSLESADNYKQVLQENFVIADVKQREQLIIEGIKEIEAEKAFQALMSEPLLEEVRNLVEYPTVFCGQFEESFLQLPREVLVTAMEEHQRYFSVETKDNDLLPYFISVRNGNDYALNKVVRGNEKVLEARLADAQFFYNEDQKQTIEDYTQRLNNVIFQDELGSYGEKTNRIVNIVKTIAQKLSCHEETISDTLRTAEICKFDLVTQMVNEFTELQGVIGEKYALNLGEKHEVASAIREHYLPFQANDPLPQSIVGAMVSIADKIDTIVGCLSIGLVPSGSQDPYGLRRQAVGILRILLERKWNISLEEFIDMALEAYQELGKAKKNVKQQLVDFFNLRAQHLLTEEKIEADVIKSVLSQGIGIFHYTTAKARVLSAKRNDPSFKQIEESLVRVLNIAKRAKEMDINETLFQTDSERKLYDAFTILSDKYDTASNDDAIKALDYLSELADPIDSFFDDNMVMDDDEKIRTNRLALLANIAKMIEHFADLTAIQWKQHV